MSRAITDRSAVGAGRRRPARRDLVAGRLAAPRSGSRDPEEGGQESGPSGLRRYLTAFTAVVTPATLVTSVLLYAGWVRTRVYYSYFGISADLLGLGPQDYILRSADVGAGAIALLALAGGVLLVLDRVTVAVLRVLDRSGGGRWFRFLLALLGTGLALGGLLDVLGQTVIALTPSLVSAGLIAAGVALLLRFGLGTPGRGALLGPSTAPFGLVVLALVGLWAVHSYARWIGTNAALGVDVDSSRFAVVTVFTDDPLDLPGRLVVRQTVTGGSPEHPAVHRYIGARLLAYGNDRWFLLTNPAHDGYRSSVVVLRDTDDIRVEVATPDLGSAIG